MVKKLGRMHVELATDVWELSTRRAALEAQLAETIALQHGAIALATEHGVQQNLLSELADLTPARISQIVAATEVPDMPREAFHSRIHDAMKRPQDQLKRLTAANAQARKDGPDKFEFINGSSDSA